MASPYPHPQTQTQSPAPFPSVPPPPPPKASSTLDSSSQGPLPPPLPQHPSGGGGAQGHGHYQQYDPRALSPGAATTRTREQSLEVLRAPAVAAAAGPPPPGIHEGWLPSVLKEQTKTDLEALLANPELLDALIRSKETAHPSLSQSDSQIQAAISQNQSLASHISSLASAVAAQRQDVASHLVQLKALERQWHLKQSAMDDALAPFGPKALHSRLVSGIAEQEGVLRAMEESFLEEDGRASEREMAEFVKRWRDARKVLVLRKERRRRFEEGRVGGWR